jgi:hypothetical protein
VTFRTGTEPFATTARLETEFGFKARYIYDAVGPGFAAELSLQTVAALRCVPEVSAVSENAYGTVLNPPPPCGG